MRKFQAVSGPSLFPTRKKSSEQAWMAWAVIAFVVIAVGWAFYGAELYFMRAREVRFFNFRSPNLKDLRTLPVENEADFSADSLGIFISNDTVVLGSVRNIIAPGPGGDVLVMSRKSLKQELRQKVPQWKHAKNIFPTRVFGVALDEKLSDQTNIIMLTGDLMVELAALNKTLSSAAKNWDVPAPLFLKMPWQR